MKKFGMVLGAAAVAAIAGCKDPNYKRGGAPAGQSEVKSADTTVAQPVTQPVAQTTAPAQKSCTCAPGTRHTRPCACGGANCGCIVEERTSAPVQSTAPAQTRSAAADPEVSVYVVQSGDYLAKISKKFNVTIAAIKKANGMKSDVVRVGQKLKIPGKVDVGSAAEPAKATAPAAAKKSAAVVAPYTGATREYVVRSGDTLGSIAYGNGINIRQLKALNGLTNDTVRVGQKLKIPAEKPAKAADARKPAKEAAEKPAKEAAAKPEAEKAPAPAEQPAAEAAPAEPVAEAAPAQEAAAKPEAEKPAAPAAATYVVQEGDDMTGVSIRWGVSAAEIRALNNLGDNDQLKPGQILKLPAEAQQ